MPGVLEIQRRMSFLTLFLYIENTRLVSLISNLPGKA